MSRKKLLILNSSAGLIKQIIYVVCGFILPRYILSYYGSSVNGLISSISHFLAFISTLEFGIGPVIQANLYDPLANNDENRIGAIIVSSEKFFRRLGFIFIIYTIILAFVYPNLINTEFDFIFTASLILILSISTLVQYLWGTTNQLLLTAAQKSYIHLHLQSVLTLVNTAVCIVLIKANACIHFVKLFTSSFFILKPLIQNIYVSKKIKINKHVVYSGEPIKQKWNGFAQHFLCTVCAGTDFIVLTFFAGLMDVSIYSIYYNITIGVVNIFMMGATGIDSLFGDMIAKKEFNTLNSLFSSIEFVFHFLTSIVFAVAAITIVPFVLVYTKGVTDTNYSVPTFGLIIVLAYATQVIRIPYARVVFAAGKFKETQNGAIISAVLNLVLTISLVFKYGLTGAALGTLIAMWYHVLYFVYYLKNNILNRILFCFIRLLLVDAFVFIIAYYFSRYFPKPDLSYISWSFYAFKITIATTFVALIINILLNYQSVKQIYLLVCNKVSR